MKPFFQSVTKSFRQTTKVVVATSFFALAAFSGAAHAAAVLTAAAVTAGFGLSTFVDRIPSNGSVGPVGVLNATGGTIMVTGYATGEIKVFSDVDGQAWSGGALAGSNYGGNDPAGLATVSGRFFLARQANGRVVEIDSSGNFIGNIGPIIGSLTTGIVGNPATGRLFVSDVFSTIWDLDPVALTATPFVNVGADGLTLSADGKTLYAASGGQILGFDTTTKNMVFFSGGIPGGVDGTALGSGSLAGNIFANTNSGELFEIDLITKVQTKLVQGGSRGDFVTVDGNNGTLLFTQTDSVLRLTAPTGGGFQGGEVPEPDSLALLGLGLLALTWRRR